MDVHVDNDLDNVHSAQLCGSSAGRWTVLQPIDCVWSGAKTDGVVTTDGTSFSWQFVGGYKIPHTSKLKSNYSDTIAYNFDLFLGLHNSLNF